MVRDAGAIFARDVQLKERAAEAAAEMEQQQRTQQAQEQQQRALQVRGAVGKVFDKLESVIPDLGEGADSMGDLRSKTLEDDFEALGPDHQAYALSAGTVLPPMVKALRARDVEIASLKEQLAAYQSATPKAAPGGGGVAAVVAPDTSGVSDDAGFMEAIEKRMGG